MAPRKSPWWSAERRGSPIANARKLCKSNTSPILNLVGVHDLSRRGSRRQSSAHDVDSNTSALQADRWIRTRTSAGLFRSVAMTTATRHAPAFGVPVRGLLSVLLSNNSVEGLRVLDLGCGEGKNAFAFAAAGASVVAVDCSELAIRNGQAAFGSRSINWVLADSSTFVRTCDEFDIVVMYGLLHCLVDLDLTEFLVTSASRGLSSRERMVWQRRGKLGSEWIFHHAALSSIGEEGMRHGPAWALFPSRSAAASDSAREQSRADLLRRE